MELINPRKWNSDVPDDLIELESHLASSFHAVHPNPEFVHTLRGRLMSTPAVVIENRERLLDVLSVLGLIMAGFTLVAGALRLGYEILAWTGMVREK
jgi:hypothetical protein